MWCSKNIKKTFSPPVLIKTILDKKNTKQGKSKMKTIPALFILIAAAQTSAFVAPSSNSNGGVLAVSSTSMNMGLLDFFSEEARQKREAKKQAEIEEQLRLQAEIYQRRKNPEKMEEYTQKVYARRELRMAGRDEEAAEITMYNGDAEKLKPTST